MTEFKIDESKDFIERSKDLAVEFIAKELRECMRSMSSASLLAKTDGKRVPRVIVVRADIDASNLDKDVQMSVTTEVLTKEQNAHFQSHRATVNEIVNERKLDLLRHVVILFDFTYKNAASDMTVGHQWSFVPLRVLGKKQTADAVVPLLDDKKTYSSRFWKEWNSFYKKERPKFVKQLFAGLTILNDTSKAAQDPSSKFPKWFISSVTMAQDPCIVRQLTALNAELKFADPRYVVPSSKCTAIVLMQHLPEVMEIADHNPFCDGEIIRDIVKPSGTADSKDLQMSVSKAYAKGGMGTPMEFSNQVARDLVSTELDEKTGQATTSRVMTKQAANKLETIQAHFAACSKAWRHVSEEKYELSALSTNETICGDKNLMVELYANLHQDVGLLTDFMLLREHADKKVIEIVSCFGSCFEYPDDDSKGPIAQMIKQLTDYTKSLEFKTIVVIRPDFEFHPQTKSGLACKFWETWAESVFIKTGKFTLTPSSPICWAKWEGEAAASP